MKLRGLINFIYAFYVSINIIAADIYAQIIQYPDNGSELEELAAKEEFELKIIQEFLPEQMSDEEVLSIVKDTIQRVGANSMQDMGPILFSA